MAKLSRLLPVLWAIGDLLLVAAVFLHDHVAPPKNTRRKRDGTMVWRD